MGPGVNSALQLFGNYAALATTSYNFAVPGLEEQTTTPTPVESQPEPEPDPANTHKARVDYNFYVAAVALPITEPNPSSFNRKDTVLADLSIQEYPQDQFRLADVRVSIPAIGFLAPVVTQIPTDYALQNGLAVHPSTYNYPNGEVILACYRRYLHFSDSRSCWHLDKIVAGHSIYVQTGGGSREYVVTGTRTTNTSDSTLYLPTDSSDFLRIVTSYSSAQPEKRLVILAKAI